MSIIFLVTPALAVLAAGCFATYQIVHTYGSGSMSTFESFTVLVCGFITVISALVTLFLTFVLVGVFSL